MSSDPPPPVPFADQLCALANITHIRDYSPTIARKPFPDQAKHLRLLDSIALLLVTEAKSDVAAVMFEQTAHAITFYYAKNRPLTRAETDYLRQLLTLALSTPDATHCAMKLLDRVIPACRPKIASRLRALIRAIKPAPHIANDTAGAFREHLVKKMPHLFPASGTLSARTVVLGYLAQVRTINGATCSENDLGKLVRFAFVIGSFEELRSIIHDEVVVRRIRKVGGYYGATKLIANTVARLPPGSPRYTTENVLFREVRPQEQSTTFLTTNHIATLNQYGASCGLGPISADALQAVFPSATTGEHTKQPTQRVTHSVHAECTLAMHALGMRKDWAFVEIGISKGSCWLCEKFLTHLRAHKVHFLVSGFHGKLQPGWTCPPGASAVDRAAAEAEVADALKEIIERVLNRRRSDSFPVAAGREEGAGREGFSDDDLSWVQGAVGEV